MNAKSHLPVYVCTLYTNGTAVILTVKTQFMKQKVVEIISHFSEFKLGLLN